jgi:polysaccharide pyruvyl transferase WcaK-like protein
MKVVQFGLRYSPNMGDGVIAECLAHAVRRTVPGATVEMVDLSGRGAFGQVLVRNRSLALKVLGVMPGPLRRRLVRWRLGRMLDRVEPDWARAVRGAQVVILGGGQIFADADLNFPLKIARAAKVVRAARVPLAIHAVGVQGGWSAEGRVLFAQVLGCDLRQVGLRDEGSRQAWLAETGGRGPAPVLTRDPGLLAAECYGPAPQKTRRIGLCVTDPAILLYHADSAVAGAGAGGIGFFRDLAAAIVDAGHKVTLFCNGAEEDRAALDAVIADPGVAAMVLTGVVSLAPPPATPRDLALTIAGMKAVVAHRLHACIVAWSYGLPVVGLGWDRKVESFFASVGAEEAFAGGDGVSAAGVADRLTAALKLRPDPAHHARVLAETEAAIAAAVHSALRSVKR